MYKLLITGHTGFVGSVLSEVAIAEKFRVFGLSRTGTEIMGIINFPRDLSQTKSFDFIDNYNIDGIIHLAANSNINECEEQTQESELLNVQASIRLAEYAKEKNMAFVFASSDQVFDGGKGNYQVSDEAQPINQYGIQKLKAEQEILKSYSKASICRLPLMIGEMGGYEKAFVENLKAGKEQILFRDEIRSVAEVTEAAKNLLEALKWEGGIFHLGGPKAINRYELGIMLAEKHGLDKNLLKPGLQSDVQMKAKRPKDVTMISNITP